MTRTDEQIAKSAWLRIRAEFDSGIRAAMPQHLKEEVEKDAQLALRLLTGRVRNSNGLTEYQFLTRDTRPTEKEARAALARLLMNGYVPDEILSALAELFLLPGDKRGPLRAVLQRRNQGHSNPHRDRDIALRVYRLIKSGDPVKAAINKVSELTGIGDRQVKRIWGASIFRQRRLHHIEIDRLRARRRQVTSVGELVT